ncbi:MAG: N-acetylglucosamine-6-phosphate deacetylase [Firmicutes bacterium]|nr:N-acetylglucosamine-6-phosphate deacetylase [Bacillota bacterium]
MLIRGALVLSGDFTFKKLDVTIQNGYITSVCQPDNDPVTEVNLREEIVDAKDQILVPGLIDVHIHGYQGISCTETNPSRFEKLRRALSRKGTTAFAPTIASTSDQKAFASIRYLSQTEAHREDGISRVLGIHMEGPFLNPVKKGAMNRSCLQMPSTGKLLEFLSYGPGFIKLMTIAPELPGALDVIRLGKELGISMSMGHTDAKREEAVLGIEAGVSRATHLFNAMRGLHHREGGVISAALLDPSIRCELIGDLVHVKPEIVRLIYQMKGREGITLITDACELSGLTQDMLPPYLPYRISDAAYLKNGTLCGSVICLLDAVRNLIGLGIKAEDAFYMATINPARDLGVQDQFGSIEPGKRADLLLLDSDFSLMQCFVGGKAAF